MSGECQPIYIEGEKNMKVAKRHRNVAKGSREVTSEDYEMTEVSAKGLRHDKLPIGFEEARSIRDMLILIQHCLGLDPRRSVRSASKPS